MSSATFYPRPAARRPRTWVGVAVIVLACVLVPAAAGAATASSVRTWYPELDKPAWTPPAWVFGPVWTVLYATMAVAASLVWAARDRADVSAPLTAFGVQLAANLAWSFLFFGLRSPLLGLIDIAVLWAAVGVTVATFWRVSRTAAWLLVPYWMWVTFAAALNAAIVMRA
jgi:tryptophan-rich sensory protein